MFCVSLLTIYKTFVRPHLDYVNIKYDKPGNVNFESKLERVQYKACLAITGAILSDQYGQYICRTRLKVTLG